METKRVEFEDGEWAEVRTRLNVGDNEYIEVKRLDRGGGQSPQLAMIDLMDRIIVSWSYDVPVSPEAIRERMQMDQVNKIAGEMMQRPNGSRPSSAGTGTRAARRRTKGQPVGA